MVRHYTKAEQADLDIKTSVNKIGEIVNLSQELNTKLWDELNGGKTYEEVEELYCDIAKLDVLSGIEIDKAKREFAVDSVAEIKALKRKYEATYGNHLRTVQNKNDSIHADNMERLIPWWLEQRLGRRDDVVFPEAEYYEFLYFNVCGYKICATHGDLDNVKSAGRTLNTLFVKKYGSEIDYVILADKHHKEEFEELGIESMVVRSLCGTDEYANGKRLYSTPGQLMMVFKPGMGADACYQIKLN